MRTHSPSGFFKNKPFCLCGKCKDGWIDMKPEKLGWERLPKFDTVEAKAWLTPGGVRYMHPREEQPLVVSMLCDCVRRAMGVPLRPREDESQAA